MLVEFVGDALLECLELRSGSEFEVGVFLTCQFFASPNVAVIEFEFVFDQRGLGMDDLSVEGTNSWVAWIVVLDMLLELLLEFLHSDALGRLGEWLPNLVEDMMLLLVGLDYSVLALREPNHFGLAAIVDLLGYVRKHLEQVEEFLELPIEFYIDTDDVGLDWFVHGFAGEVPKLAVLEDVFLPNEVLLSEDTVFELLLCFDHEVDGHVGFGYEYSTLTNQDAAIRGVILIPNNLVRIEIDFLEVGHYLADDVLRNTGEDSLQEIQLCLHSLHLALRDPLHKSVHYPKLKLGETDQVQVGQRDDASSPRLVRGQSRIAEGFEGTANMHLLVQALIVRCEVLLDAIDVDER